MIEKWSRGVFLALSVFFVLMILALGRLSLHAYWAFIIVGPIVLIGLHDITQKRHSVLRNYPIIGHFRYFLESIRTEIRQYFIESDDVEYPFSREMRSLVYQRAKTMLDTLPFGTRIDVYKLGYEWISHSLKPAEPNPENAWVTIGGDDCKQPYHASIFNVSAMSFGSLSKNAVLALNHGAKRGGFYHNTGEGGISPYHLEPGGDLMWQIGTGYFGCRTPEGKFDADRFQASANLANVKMIEIKLSQGAKPAHGGILPAVKLTEEIAAMRGVPMGKDVISPPAHNVFSTPLGLMEFIAQLRQLSGGKPVGFKMCIGMERDFLALCKAMLQSGIVPDFITVDGAEGGTGAAPLEFSNYVGMPVNDGLSFVHNALSGVGLRHKIKIVAAGKIVTGFHVLTKIALGADLCDAARAMMFAIGCIQALKCNTNHCPAGVATQDPHLMQGLIVEDKSERVYNYHRKTVESALELLAAAGLNRFCDLKSDQIFRRTGVGEIKSLEQIYPPIGKGDFLNGKIPDRYKHAWETARADRF